MRSNQKLFSEELNLAPVGDPKVTFLQGFVELEAEQKVLELNYDDNKKTIKKMAKEDVQKWMSGYTSTARTLYRGCWFMDFLHAIFAGFYNDKESKLSKVATAAYNTALAPHHPWMLKKVAGVAMNAINYRAVFIKNMVDEQTKVLGREYTEENVYEDLKLLSDEAGILAKHLWALCQQNGFDKLP